VDVLLMPTAGTIYTKSELEAEPIKLNSNLGRYTNFMNLLDLCGCAVPSGFLSSQLPWGVTFYAPACGDALVLDCAAHFHAARNLPVGSTAVMSRNTPLPSPLPTQKPTVPTMQLAVCGAHMEGLALHWQLREREARFIERTTSAPCYRFYHLPAQGRIPDRPGMVRVHEGGAAIEMEVWELPQASVGSFLEGIGAPLGLGKVELADGRKVTGFICEAVVTHSATDITGYGSWRKWLEAQL
jgi:allophanate hydrolase